MEISVLLSSLLSIQRRDTLFALAITLPPRHFERARLRGIGVHLGTVGQQERTHALRSGCTETVGSHDLWSEAFIPISCMGSRLPVLTHAYMLPKFIKTSIFCQRKNEFLNADGAKKCSFRSSLVPFTHVINQQDLEASQAIYAHFHPIFD